MTKYNEQRVQMLVGAAKVPGLSRSPEFEPFLKTCTADDLFESARRLRKLNKALGVRRGTEYRRRRAEDR